MHKGKVYLVIGKTDTEQREIIRKLVETEKDAVIIASYGVFSVGVNIRNIRNIVFAAPSKSKIRVLQSIGRGLRKSEIKTKCFLFDVVDDLTKGKSKNYTMNHSIDRMKYYVSEKHQYKIVTFSIDK